jgi:hypothetical protein
MAGEATTLFASFASSTISSASTNAITNRPVAFSSSGSRACSGRSDVFTGAPPHEVGEAVRVDVAGGQGIAAVIERAG